MKSACRASAAAALAALALGCAGRGPTPYEAEPVAASRPPRAALPDAAERAAARAAAAALGGDVRGFEAARAELERDDAERVARGEPVSGLADNVAEIAAVGPGSDAFPARAESLLERDDLDDALRLRLERAIAEEPRRLAETRLAEERRARTAALVNRVTETLARFVLSGVLNPIDATRTTLATLLTAHHFPSASPRERQALHLWDGWLRRHPDSPEAPEIAARAARLRARLARARAEASLDSADQALDEGAWAQAEILAARAGRQNPGNARAAELERRAAAPLAARDAEVRSSLALTRAVPAGLDEAQSTEYLALARAALVDDARAAAARAEMFRNGGAPPALGPQLRLVEGFAPLARGDEDAWFEALAAIPTRDVAADSGAQQAAALLTDPDQNPYAYYRAARSADRRARTSWLLLGRHARGPLERDLPRPLEYVLDLPGFAVSLLLLPLRVVQYPSISPRFGDSVLQTGESYVARRPRGLHAEEVHADLESRYAARDQPGAALRHAEARAEPDAEELAEYRDAVAAQLLAAAERERRIDIKLALYAALLREHPDSAAAAQAGRQIAELKRTVTPQRIRLTRDFLREHPELFAPGALDLHPELLDGSRANGELAKEGVSLLGRSVLEIALLGREPVTRELEPERFARFVALLEESSRATLASDARERAAPDPARDAFFASARLGLLENPDTRPSARSEAVFESKSEKHGNALARESILPVDLVLRGDLESLGLAAFPRLRSPQTPPEALLYE